jgi:RHS repeat-associated protein
MTAVGKLDQRFYTSQFGRFMSADRFKRAAKVNDSGSWNKYSYTRGDPVNRFDRHGTEDWCTDDCEPPCEGDASAENCQDPGGGSPPGAGGGSGGGGGGSNFLDDQTTQAQDAAYGALGKTDCWQFITAGTKAASAADAQSNLKLYFPVTLADLGPAVVTGSSPNYNVNIKYGNNGDGGDIVLNSYYFPNDTVKNINVGGLAQSALDVFNKANNSSLNGLQLELRNL